MGLAAAHKEATKNRNHRNSGANLTPLEAEIIALFVQMSRALGHPCKIYNILTVAAPVLYIGPSPSHLSEILKALNGEYNHASAAHGDVDQIVKHIKRARQEAAAHDRKVPVRVLSNFSKETVLPKLIGVLGDGKWWNGTG